MSDSAEWIAVDWGTSRLRLWPMRGGTPLAALQSDQGMARLERNGFEPALLALSGEWIGETPLDVIACGMVGARQGWVEAPYAAVPAAALPGTPVRVPGTDARLRAYVVPGLKQIDPPDVMRGEETQIAGFLTQNPNWDGVIVLPGTHSKWAQISADEVVSFRSFMTGELFDLLGTHSVLCHSVEDGWDEAAFANALGETLSRPENLAARLFGIRARDLLQGQGGATARSQLSGYLIGAELAATRPYWLGQQLAVVGAPGVAEVYATALRQQGAFVQIADATQATLAGLVQMRDRLRG